MQFVNEFLKKQRTMKMTRSKIIELLKRLRKEIINSEQTIHDWKFLLKNKVTFSLLE